MKYYPSDYAQILYKTKDTDALIELLKQHWVLAWLPKITQEFERLQKKEEHIEEVTVASAYPLGDEVENNIVRLLESIKNEKKLEFNFTIDKGLISGFRVESDEMMIAASINDRIRQLTEKL